MGINRLKKASAFTLVEVLVVIMIVGILAAWAAPLMRGRVDSAKWSEGRSMMGSIATAMRTYVAENDRAPPVGVLSDESVRKTLGFAEQDVDSTYFDPGDFEISNVAYDPYGTTTLQFLITATKIELDPGNWTLNQNGVWGHK
jgi:prepilin-type N-terminal cleavage/methylation domain-containing protein